MITWITQYLLSCNMSMNGLSPVDMSKAEPILGPNESRNEVGVIPDDTLAEN